MPGGNLTKNSTFGIDNMGRTPYTAKEICHIIKVCKKLGVMQLKLGDVFISFQIVVQKPLDRNVKKGAYAVNTVPLSGKGDENLSFELQNKEIMNEVENAQLMIDDPMGYEKRQIDMHLRSHEVYRQDEET